MKVLGALSWFSLSLVMAGSAGAQVADHLQCFKVRAPHGTATYTADFGGLVAEHGCKITTPAAFECVTTIATNLSPAPSRAGGSGRPHSFTCYRLRCPTPTVPTVTASDEFGTRTVTIGEAQLVCAPNAGAAAGGFPATGQTTCWDTSDVPIPCAGTGEDGDIRAGAVLAYSDNSDGTVTDLNTGLVWEKVTSDGSVHDMNNFYTWQEAITVHVATLNAMNFAGHSDWRLPNIKELMSILNYEQANPAVSSIFGPVPIYSDYWSSTVWAFSPNFALAIHFFDGSVQGMADNNTFGARAVREGG
jgi:hypothetical protein